MLEAMGFQVLDQRYDSGSGPGNASGPKSIKYVIWTAGVCLMSQVLRIGIARRLLHAFMHCILCADRDPSLRATQVSLAVKKEECLEDLSVPDVVLPP